MLLLLLLRLLLLLLMLLLLLLLLLLMLLRLQRLRMAASGRGTREGSERDPAFSQRKASPPEKVPEAVPGNSD